MKSENGSQEAFWQDGEKGGYGHEVVEETTEVVAAPGGVNEEEKLGMVFASTHENKKVELFN